MENAVFSELAVGSVFVGRYLVERRMAVGGMGAVYEVVHIETNRRRALKVMHAHYVSSDELRARFRQEARVAAEIESEHIVDIFDAGIDEATGMPFLVMELLRGEDLGKLVKRVGALSREDVVRYLYETSLALDLTHQARIVHRDLKPDNLFLSERGRGRPRVKVLDFGIAKIVKDAHTQANATRALGTPLYMAPEQFLLQSAVSGATDIFALGMIAFTLLVGKPYWFKESKMAGEVIAFAIHASHGPTESAVSRAWELYGVELPKDFDAWFFQATAANPTERFASAGEAVIALADALGVCSPNDEESQIKSSFFPPNTEKTMLLQANPLNDTATILLPSVSNSSPSGPLRSTAPTQLAVVGSSPETPDNRSKPSSPLRSFVLIGFGTAAAVCLGGFLVFKGFGASSEKAAESAARIEIPALQEAEAALPTLLPSAVASAPLSSDLAPMASAPETLASASNVEKTTSAPNVSALAAIPNAIAAPSVSAVAPTSTVRPSVTVQPFKKKQSAPNDATILPQD